MRVIANLCIVEGKDMQLIEQGYITIDEDGKIAEVNTGDFKGAVKEKINGKGLLAIPGLINAHTHVGDSVAKDLGFGKGVLELMKPPDGLKHQTLRDSTRRKLMFAMSKTLDDMLYTGTTTFVDFREEGILGVKLLRQALVNRKVKAVILGRPSFYMDESGLAGNEKPLPIEAVKEAEALMKVADGVGLSSPNEYTDKALSQISNFFLGTKLIATHAAEYESASKISELRTGLSEVSRALRKLKSDFLVHLTYASDEDIDEVARSGRGVVLCPKANALLGLGFPPVRKLTDRGVKLAIGSDNVMVNQPDMLSENNYVYCFVKALERKPDFLSPKDVLKMATINAAEMLKINSKVGSIEEGKSADLVFLDMHASNLSPTRNLLASVVHRARPDNIKLVIIDGEIALDRRKVFG